jgi:tetratricopeptide (TPR) repeat protein
MARRVGDQEALADVLLARCTSTLRPETLLQRLDDAAELSHIAPSLTDPARRARSFLNGARTNLLAGRVLEADTLLRAADESANEIRQPALQWINLCVHVGRTMMSGRLADAERLAAETAEIGRIAGQRESEWAFGMQRFLIAAERGGVDDEISGVLKRIADDFRAAGGSLIMVDIAAALAAKLAGHTAETQAGFDRLTRRPTNLDYFSIFGEVLLAQLMVEHDKTDEAADVYQRLAPYPEWVVPVHVFPTPSVSFHLGLLAGFLGRFDAAEEHFTEAAADHERIGAPTYLARTRLEWARTLLARGGTGDEDRARALLIEASAVAEELGLLGVEREAAALLGR